MALNLMTGVNILNAILGGEKLPDNNHIVALAAKGMEAMQKARQEVCGKPKPSGGKRKLRQGYLEFLPVSQ